MLSISHLCLPTHRTTRFSISAPKPSPGFLQVLSSSTSGEKQEPSSMPAPAATSVPFPAIKVAKRVVLVRHGQSTWNAEGRIQGSSDFSVLTTKGENQAETSRLMLINDLFDVCFSSPLKRSKRTAEIIWGGREEAVLTDYDLREIDLYSFQGLLKHEGKDKYGDTFHQWQIDAPNFVIDGHYPVRELWARARNCWDRILAHEGRSVLVVAHNAVNQALLATAIGLGTDYFRVLLQSNCGVSVLDFNPTGKTGSPHICLNRLNQTPGAPVSAESSGGRKTSERIILVCHGSLQTDAEAGHLNLSDQPMNMLGHIQAQKIAELILDVKINTIYSSSGKASKDTAAAISRVQEAADCLGADSVPRCVDMKELKELNVENILQPYNKVAGQNQNPQSISLQALQDGALETLWNQTGNAWQSLLDNLSRGATSEPQTIVVVGHPGALVALVAHCLNLTKDWLGSFHVDEGSISIIDLPDGPGRRGVVRCINYTAHLGRWSIPITKPKVDEEGLY